MTTMNRFLSLGFTIGLALSVTPASFAVAPVTISQSTKVELSQVMDDPFDGKVVYDKNFDPGGTFEFISRWSPQGIQATYKEYFSEIAGYRTVWRSDWVGTGKKRREIRYPDQEPIYRRYSTNRTPKAIKFAINGQVLTYEQGTVSPELATALASAPSGNMTIRLMWDDGGSTDMVIGRGTVAAWKTIFRSGKTPTTVIQ
ncbi:MAG: hypothetical protein IGS48_21295 [Oscillatoriales cyanobacterium C42_A2020_001]|nr:hypothetical protein [Leptolyngbyaceae cyanobacterium C42_A2020_001]